MSALTGPIARGESPCKPTSRLERGLDALLVIMKVAVAAATRSRQKMRRIIVGGDSTALHPAPMHGSSCIHLTCVSPALPGISLSPDSRHAGLKEFKRQPGHQPWQCTTYDALLMMGPRRCPGQVRGRR